MKQALETWTSTQNLSSSYSWRLTHLEQGMPVMKFGGSSVADADKIRRVADIVIEKSEKESTVPVVVVSAMKGITDSLIGASEAALAGDAAYKAAVTTIRTRHAQALEELTTPGENREAVGLILKETEDELAEILHGVELVRECSPRTADLITGFGERLSSVLLAAHLRERGKTAEAVDARQIIRTDDTHGRAIVDFEATYPLIRARIGNPDIFYVVTGFIASTADGVATTLGRNGSDYTASILGAALESNAVEIWTDVDGVLTADPRIVDDAWVIPEISFQEAMELSFFGAEVIHPYTLVPVVEKGLPVVIKNTLNPSAPGTRICHDPKSVDRAITGIASIDDVAMVTVEGGGMVGMPGIAGKLFSSVASAGANIIMITQSSSEHSICMVFRRGDARKAAQAIRQNLADALASRMIRDVRIDEGLEMMAVIGENMRGQLGLSGKLFSALGDAGVNILAIAQGSTELNISFVIHGEQTKTAINAVHKAFIG